MALGQSVRNAIGTAWRGIASGVRQGLSTLGIGEAVSTGLQRAGLSPALIDTSIVDQLSGMARGMENAAAAVAAADQAAPVDSSMVALAPWSMDLNSFNAQPAYDLQIGINIPGQAEPVYRIIAGLPRLPATVGELQNLADVNAAGLAAGEGVTPTLTGTAGATVGSITVTVAPRRA